MKKNLFKDISIIAHRGLHNQKISENSILAFREACKKNMPIELDIHLLQDHNIIVYHDDYIKVKNKKKPLKEITYQQLQTDFPLNNSEIPLFKTALEEVNGKVPILIEIKTDQKFKKLEKETIKILKNYKGLYFIQSFRLRSILYLKRKLHCKVGLLIHTKTNTQKNWFFNSIILKILKIDFLSYPFKNIPNKKIEKLNKKIPVLLWTIHNQEEQKRAEKYCDAIIFENTSCEIN